jgi:hypothetical protein
MSVYLQWGRQARGRLRDTWSQGHMRTALMIMSYPCVQHMSQVVLSEGNQKVQTLPPERAQQPFTQGIRLGTAHRGFEHSQRLSEK